MEQKCKDPGDDEAIENHHSLDWLSLWFQARLSSSYLQRKSFYCSWKPLTGLFLKNKTKHWSFSLTKELVITIGDLYRRHLPKYAALPTRILKGILGTFDGGQRPPGKIFLKKYRLFISCSQLHFLNSSLILQVIHNVLQSECLYTLLDRLDAHQYPVFLSLLGTWETMFPDHFCPMDREWKCPVPLSGGGIGKPFCTSRAHSSLANLAWKPWVKMSESEYSSSPIPRSQVGRELL